MCDDLIKTILGMLAAKQIVIIPSKDFKFFIIHPKSLIGSGLKSMLRKK